MLFSEFVAGRVNGAQQHQASLTQKHKRRSGAAVAPSRAAAHGGTETGRTTAGAAGGTNGRPCWPPARWAWVPHFFFAGAAAASPPTGIGDVPLPF